MSASIIPIMSSISVNPDRKLRIAEIGARYGESSIFMLSNFTEIEKYYIIDPYESYEDYAHDGFDKEIKKNSGDKLYEDIKSKLSNYPSVEFLREYSSTGHEKIADEELDLCYIDGNHSYEYVLEDIKNFFPKIKPGGLICGDDFFMRHKFNNGDYDQKMVFEAVMEFFSSDKYCSRVISFGSHGPNPSGHTFPSSWGVIKRD